MLFSSLYRSWCHNPVAVFALCLLAQAYEHASNLLQILYVDCVLDCRIHERRLLMCPVPISN